MVNMELTLREAAFKLLTRFLQLDDREILWAFSDIPPDELGRRAIQRVVTPCNATIRWIDLPALKSNGQEPAIAITAVRPHGTPVLAYTSYSLSSTAFRSQVCSDGGRFYSIPGGAPALALLAVEDTDIALMKTRGEKIKTALERARKVRLCWDSAELIVPLSIRPARVDLGLCHQPGSFASPSFEVNTVPLEYSAQGQIQILGALPELEVFASPVISSIEGGILTDCVCGASQEDVEKWKMFLNAAQPALLRVAELGFGLNHNLSFPAETYMANESVWGTVHIGIGRNLTLGGTFEAPGHIDLVTQPDQIWIDDQSLAEIAAITDEDWKDDTGKRKS